MSPVRAAAAATFAAFLLGGCAGAEDRPERQLSVTLKDVPLADYGPGPDDCFVATPRAEVRIAGGSPRRGQLCRELAGRYLPREGPLVWRPVRHERDAPTLICFFVRGDEIVEILSASYDSGRVDADAICERLEEDKWERRSPFDAP
jgi:hypothetical protein